MIALSVEDHYTRVRTTKGEELLLLRLSDAIRETAPVAGLQVHRSHWVASDQVTGSRRDRNRTLLILRNGDEIPVSRANMRAVREAGLLPRN
ncbi:MAG: LytTR family DNA-binding domain-containing protein [Boseongicola sp.]|nr:LytTR family DNA-binding domain-containing protein [Boseongicola sp.]